MFPWSPEFGWDVPHLAFFGALYCVLATIAVTVFVAGWRARRDARTGRAAAIAWHGEFDELPRAARACRHQLTGEAPGRLCARGFDCRGCGDHVRLEARRREDTAARESESGGLGVPTDRFYHRGHTFVRVEDDGTVTVGLDDVARRLVGDSARIELPAPGSRLEVNGPAGRVFARGHEVRVLSPVEGTVIGSEGEGGSFSLRVDPGGSLDVRHLLSGPEVRAWTLRELERLQSALGAAGVGAALADGGELVADVGAALPPGHHDRVLGEMLLEP